MMQVPPSIKTALQEAVVSGVFPGAVLAIRRGGEGLCVLSAGRLSVDPPGAPVSASTLYDLASLTKPLATVTSLALLVQEGRCQPNDRVDAVLPELEEAPVGSATLLDVLSHSSGLPAWRGFYEHLSPTAVLPSAQGGRVHAGLALLDLIKKEAVIYANGQRSLYSDVGFMLLGLIVERLSGMTIDRVMAERIAQPLGASCLSFLTSEEEEMRQKNGMKAAIAPTEFDSWRGRLLHGEVHDENAAALGGVAGHAGLFGTAESVLAVTGAWLKAYHGQPTLLNAGVVREFTRRQDRVPQSSWAMGWDTPSTPSSSGQYFSSRSFGHLGYTGTSIWIDPVCELEVVLLSNRVHPSRKNEAIRAFRPAIHDLIYQECVAGSQEWSG
jgi:serine-type D-Ala-D-Ala carboxypeptidase